SAKVSNLEELAKSDEFGNVKASLENAAFRGVLKMFELLQKSGFGLRNKAYRGLGFAIGKGHYDVVKHILDGEIAEADIVPAVNVGLKFAADRDDLNIFEFLAEYGFRVGDRYEEARAIAIWSNGVLAEADAVSEVKSGLEGAATRGVLEMFELLEEYGFEVRRTGYLVSAAESYCSPLVKFMMDHDKVDINGTDRHWTFNDASSFRSRAWQY
ncbi:hypothetical protein N7517_005769, partial [Penicillium concentricum]